MKILLVEDELKIANLLKLALEKQKHLVTWIDRGDTAKDTLESDDFDIAILDVALPGANGFSVCKHIRSLGLKMPILMLTARDSVQDKVAGLDSGADDYLTKPFELDELLARIRALSRREELVHSEVLSHRDLQLDPKAVTVTLKGQKLDLSKKEYRFLEYLLRRKDQVCPKSAVSEHLWEGDYLYTPQQIAMLDVTVSRLRKKISAIAADPYIETVNKQGYRLV